jgi:hypothetical protein
LKPAHQFLFAICSRGQRFTIADGQQPALFCQQIEQVSLNRGEFAQQTGNFSFHGVVRDGRGSRLVRHWFSDAKGV